MRLVMASLLGLIISRPARSFTRSVFRFAAHSSKSKDISRSTPRSVSLVEDSLTIPSNSSSPSLLAELRLDESDDGYFQPVVTPRPEDFQQKRELDQILTERAARFYDPVTVGIQREKCILVSVERKLENRRQLNRKTNEFSHLESLSELSELVGTAGLQVMSSVVQKLSNQNAKTYVGPGKIPEIMRVVNETLATCLVIDDDLSTKQQRNLEDAFAANGGRDIKILDRYISK